MEKVALVQSQIYFTPETETKDLYLGSIPLLTSSDVVEIYNFIQLNARKNGIYKYVLLITSDVLSTFIDYIYKQKIDSACAKDLLSKCIFVATCSNADSVRQQNIEKKTNIFFSLSPLLINIVN